jgi:hypothetical protein
MTTTPQQPDTGPGDDFISTEEFVRRQRVQPIASVTDLAAEMDPIESDQEYDEFLADLLASRRTDIA